MIIEEIVRRLAENSSSRIAVFIRHGEKDNSSSGPAIITEQAKKDAAAMGLLLRDFNIPVKVYSSPELRCMQTAKIINRKISGANNDIILTSFLGRPGIQVKDNKRYLDIFDKSDARKIYSQWKSGQHYDALRTIEELRSELTSFLEAVCAESKISLFISQSGTVAALSYALGVSDYDIEKKEWVPFLDGFVIACQ